MSELKSKERNKLGNSNFAFAEQRKEPLENASHVRNAIARFNQVKDVSDDERDAAWRKIKVAAKKHGVVVGEKGCARSARVRPKRVATRPVLPIMGGRQRFAITLFRSVRLPTTSWARGFRAAC